MTSDDTDLQNLYQRATRRGAGSDCPSEETLMKAATNKLPSREREAVALHVAKCSDCARDFRIARSLAPWAAEASKNAREEERNLSPFAIAVTVAIAVSIPLIVWMVLARTGASKTIDRLYAEIARRDQEIRVLRTASLAMRTRLDQQLTPEIGAPIVDLDADSARGLALPAPGVTTIEVPKTTRSITLIAHLPFPHARSLELRDDEEQLLWRADAPQTDSGSITVTLPRELVPPGDYVLRATNASGRADFKFRTK